MLQLRCICVIRIIKLNETGEALSNEQENKQS